MLRGQFVSAGGLVIPNNVTIWGAEKVLDLAFRAGTGDMFVGLCSAVYDPDLTAADLEEPTLGLNGYARQPLTRDTDGWPGTGEVNGERYIESDWFIWTAVGGNFSKAISRMFIIFDIDSLTDPVFALSATLPEERIITPTTVEGDRKFKYQLFLR